MNRVLATAALALAALFAGPALATDSPVERVKIRGLGTVDYQQLFTETSQQGETLDAFAVRIAPRLRAFSDATGFEACGVLATDGERFGAVIGSNHSHVACANFAAMVPAGMKATAETIHSHGTDRPASLNANDLALQGKHLAGQGGTFRTVSGQTLDEFSRTDYQGGAGYLAAPGQVLHQAGKGTTRVVSAK